MRIYSPIIIDSAEISGSLKVTGSANFEYNVTVTGSLIAPSITGSLFGTSSWANNAISSSYAQTASFVLNAISSSYAQTASFVLNAISSSFASTASYVNPLRQDVQISGSLRVTGSGNHYIVGENIGINKINPTNPLDVVGTTFISGGLFTRGQGVFINSNENDGSTQLQVTYGYARGEFLIKPSGSKSVFLFSPNGGMNIGGDTGWEIGSTIGSPPERGLAVSGSVGIGTRQPTQKLHVSGGSVLIEGGNFLYLRDTTTKIYEGSGLTLDSGATSRPIKIMAGGSNLVYISGSGNVGFGTSTPTETVHVIGNITGSGTLGIRNRTTLWGDVSLYGGNNNTTIGLDYIYTGSLLGKSNVLHFRQGGSTAGAIMFTYYGTNPMLTIIPSDFPTARVGINTPNPEATLHVSGSSGSVVFEVDSNSSPNIIYASGSGNVGFGTATPGVKVDVVGQIRSNSTIFSSANQTQKIIINSATQLTFENTGSVEIARVTNAGNWGFGTTNPQYKLDVSGSGNFTNNLTVTGSLIAPSITGSLFGTASYALQALSSSYAVTASHALNVSVRTEGSSLYSFNPNTFNFSQVDGIFLGTNAGLNASVADGAVMIGGDAGQGATNAEYSIMIGTSAGSGAPNTARSIFLGNNAGFSASNAAYSNFIGHNAGSGNNIGQNNILIGTGVALPSGSRDRINIAGLIFGSGSYFNESDTSSGSANGKIGINQPNPQREFDVSGSVRVSRLSTSLTAPTTSGTTKMVITDSNGDLSFDNIPTGGSAFPYTGSAQITGSLVLTGSLLVTQSYISTIDYIDFTLTADPPHNEGRIHWIDDTKTLNIDTDVNGVTIEVGHQNVVRVRNSNPFTLTKGTIVFINGESGNRPTVATASWTDDSLSATTLGFVAQDINSSHTGYVISRGIIRDINTNAYSPGTMLFLSASGQYTSTVPQSPLHEVRLGRTITQGTAGTIYVDIMNGYEIGELHDVLINGKQNGDLITWDTGSRVWKNTKILSGSYGISGSLTVSQGITGSLFGTASEVQNAAVKISGSTLYSTVNSLSDFATNNSVLLGSSAGTGTSGGSFAVLIGDSAGQNATNMTYTVGIGSRAGLSQVSSSYSIFIGRNAGRAATVANQLGRNNIVIGTGISLSGSKQDSINIGGLIFGSGSYYGPAAGTTFLGSANGKVGINQPDPLYSFDVSGSGNYTNGLTVTGSVIAPSITGSLFGTSSYATQALSSSFAISSSFGATSLSSSYALTASYALNAAPMNVVYITGSATQLRISSGSINTYYRISTTGTFEVAIDTNSSKPGIPTGSQIIIEKLITGSVTISTSAGVGYTGSLYIPYQYQTLTLTKVNTDEWVGVGGYDNQLITFNSQSSTTYTLVKEDIGKTVRLNNASAITVTVPPNSSQAFPIGAIVSLEQQGAGIVTCITGSGVTINSTARKTWGQYSVIQVYKVGTDIWNVIGGVE